MLHLKSLERFLSLALLTTTPLPLSPSLSSSFSPSLPLSYSHSLFLPPPLFLKPTWTPWKRWFTTPASILTGKSPLLSWYTTGPDRQVAPKTRTAATAEPEDTNQSGGSLLLGSFRLSSWRRDFKSLQFLKFNFKQQIRFTLTLFTEVSFQVQEYNDLIMTSLVWKIIHHMDMKSDLN